MADRIAVLDRGHILQIGTPTEIYDHPATTMVAQLVGTPRINLVPAHHHEGGLKVENADLVLPLDGMRTPENVLVGIRPEDIRLGSSGAYTGTVVLTEPLGVETIVHVRCGEQVLLSVVAGAVPYQIDSSMHFDVVRERLHYFSQDGQRLNRTGAY